MNSSNDNQAGGPGGFGGFPSDDSGAPGFGGGSFGSSGTGSFSPRQEAAPQAGGFSLDDGSGAPVPPVPSAAAPVATATGPWAWVTAAVITAVVGLVLGGYTLLATEYTDSVRPVAAGIGWFLSGILTFIFLGVHVTEDTKRQAAGPYIGTVGQVYLYRASVAVGLIGVVLTAVALAQWIGVQR